MILNPTVFGTELLLSTLIIIMIEAIIAIALTVNFFRREKNPSRLSFLLLTLAFLNYNITDGLLPDENFDLPLVIQYVLEYGSCIIVASYYFYYLAKEVELELNALFNPKVLFTVLVLTFCLTYLTSYYLMEDFNLSRMMFMGFSILISVYFCISTVNKLFKMGVHKEQNTPFRAMAYSSYLGIIFMATMPITDALYQNQFYTLTLVNMSFFLCGWVYLRRCIFQTTIRFMWFQFNKINHPLKSIEDISEALTNREIEVAYMIIQSNITYSTIAERMYISDKTVSKHASNIFKKTGVKNRKEFMKTYVLDSSDLSEE